MYLKHTHAKTPDLHLNNNNNDNTMSRALHPTTRRMIPKPVDDGSLLLDDLHEESSIESSLNSENEDFELYELGDSDLDSEVDSVEYGGSADTDSVESPLLSDSELDLSDTLNDDDDDDDDDESSALRVDTRAFLAALPTLLPQSSLPLTKITEHTRETSSSCHTSIRDDGASCLHTPSGRRSARMGRSTPGSRKRSSMESATLPTTVIEWAAGLSLSDSFNLIQPNPPNTDGKAQKV